MTHNNRIKMQTAEIVYAISAVCEDQIELFDKSYFRVPDSEP